MMILGIVMISIGIAISIGAMWAFAKSNFITDLCVMLVPSASILIVAGVTVSIIGIVDWVGANVVIK